MPPHSCMQALRHWRHGTAASLTLRARILRCGYYPPTSCKHLHKVHVHARFDIAVLQSPSLCKVCRASQGLPEQSSSLYKVCRAILHKPSNASIRLPAVLQTSPSLCAYSCRKTLHRLGLRTGRRLTTCRNLHKLRPCAERCLMMRQTLHKLGLRWLSTRGHFALLKPALRSRFSCSKHSPSLVEIPAFSGPNLTENRR